MALALVQNAVLVFDSLRKHGLVDGCAHTPSTIIVMKGRKTSEGSTGVAVGDCGGQQETKGKVEYVGKKSGGWDSNWRMCMKEYLALGSREGGRKRATEAAKPLDNACRS